MKKNRIILIVCVATFLANIIVGYGQNKPKQNITIITATNASVQIKFSIGKLTKALLTNGYKVVLINENQTHFNSTIIFIGDVKEAFIVKQIPAFNSQISINSKKESFAINTNINGDILVGAADGSLT